MFFSKKNNDQKQKMTWLKYCVPHHFLTILKPNSNIKPYLKKFKLNEVDHENLLKSL